MNIKVGLSPVYIIYYNNVGKGQMIWLSLVTKVLSCRASAFSL